MIMAVGFSIRTFYFVGGFQKICVISRPGHAEKVSKETVLSYLRSSLCLSLQLSVSAGAATPTSRVMQSRRQQGSAFILSAVILSIHIHPC